MPTSTDKGKSYIKQWFGDREDIKTVVDLGPGCGTYPMLLGKNEYIWKAVEIWAPYIERFNLNDIYKEIRIGDIRYIEIPIGDCVIIGDVLEHIEKDDAIETFKKIDKQFKHVVLSIPVGSDSQYAFEGNYFEKHLSTWSTKELENLVGEKYKKRYFYKREGLPDREMDIKIKSGISGSVFIK